MMRTNKLIAKIRNFKTNERGTTAVEFGLIAVVFVALIFGILEMGRAFYTLNSFQYVIEGASRYALVNENITDQEITDYVIQQAQGMGLDENRIQVTILSSTVSGVNFIDVNGSFAFETMTPFLPAAMNAITMSVNSRLPVP